MFPEVVTVGMVLGANKTAAVCITHIAVYPSGLIVALMTLRRDTRDLRDLSDPHLASPHASPRTVDDDSEETLGFGVGFSNGSFAVSEAATSFDPRGDSVEVKIRRLGGRGSYVKWEQEYWVWPIPPPGEVRFICEWKTAEIQEGEVRLDAATLRHASRRAIKIF